MERRRLAQELEDTLISQINLIMGQLNAYEQTARGESRLAFSVLANLVRQLMQQAYDMAANLNPATLENLGLEAALEALANQQRRNHGVNLVLTMPHSGKRLSAVLELALFRLTQDAVRRAILHGNASHIWVQLRRTATRLYFVIEDNGLKTEPLNLDAGRERIAVLGGGMTFGESRNGGVEISVEFDLGAAVDLTEREMDVIKLVAEGLTNRAIAFALDVRPRTVKFHLDNIFSKLGVSSRTQAAIYALRQGWVEQHPPAQADVE
jgi:signal transduction histidine kinase/DNA-binding CsgD family transcriptional regulator